MACIGSDHLEKLKQSEFPLYGNVQMREARLLSQFTVHKLRKRRPKTSRYDRDKNKQFLGTWNKRLMRARAQKRLFVLVHYRPAHFMAR